jgi:MarR family transcriptional regulator, organic hydroperoxide resistance regulator
MPQPRAAESLEFLLVQVCRLHHARAQGLLEAIGLHRGQPPLLHALWDREGQTHSQLAERLGLAAATVTRMLQRMEKAGFVVRQADGEDERVSRVYLSESGRAIRSAVQQVWQTMERENLAGLTEEELRVLQRCLLQMRDNLRRATGSTLEY